MDRLTQYKLDFPAYVTHHGGSNGKAEDISKQFEQKGIALLSLMKYKDALEAFNTSLSYSPLDALRGSLHTHRAKAFMHCKLYESALKNVDLAKDYGIDFATHETKRICENQTTYTNYALSTELHNEIMGLSYVKNPKVPAVVHCIKLESDWKYGRHIIATQALVTGDIIAIEEPFWQSMISKKHHNKDAEVQCCYKRCYHCFKNSAMNLVACDTCEIAMFCSVECKTDAVIDYHGIECMLPRRIKESSGYLRTFRPLFVALSLFKGSVPDLEEFLTNKRTVTVFDFNFADKKDPMYRKNMFLASWFLKPTMKGVDIDEKLDALRLHPTFRRVFEGKKEFLKQFLQKSEEIFKGNYIVVKKWPLDVGNMAARHRIFGTDLISPMMFKNTVGFGCFPFTSLLNHSCAPNCVSMINKSGKMVTVVLRGIPKGGQLFINYMNQEAANYFVKTPYNIRQLTLYHRFGFRCDCEACTLILPPFFNKWKNNLKEGEFMRNLSKEFMQIGPIRTTIKYRQECTIIGANFNQSPTEQMAMSTETLIHYFGLISYPFYKFPEY